MTSVPTSALSRDKYDVMAQVLATSNSDDFVWHGLLGTGCSGFAVAATVDAKVILGLIVHCLCAGARPRRRSVAKPLLAFS